LKSAADTFHFLQAQLDIKGRIYYSKQGVNAQFGGPKEQCLAYTDMVRRMDGFEGLRFSVWPANGPMFPKLRLKYKPNLISLA
jgi:predicted sulfurtransferase